MSLLTVSRFVFQIAFLIFLFNPAYSQDRETQKVRIMFYNVENLFDIKDDTLRDDEEFLPEGSRKWTSSRYKNKLNSIYRTIVAAGEWHLPDLIGFSEIENKKVIEDLILNTNLSRFNYGIVHEESSDLRGIDVGLIYRRETIKIINYSSWMPLGYSGNNFQTRSVLYVKCIILKDTVHVLVNHWPSRLGGVLANGTLRKDIAEMLKERTDSIILCNNGKARIIVMGDFNCLWSDDEMRILTGSVMDSTITQTPPGLINLSVNQARAGTGTYKYQGMWEMLDQIIVSDFLTKCDHGLSTDIENFRVFDNDFLLRSDLKYPGLTPFSTYYGFKYQGGYSDHLPVLLELEIK